jgi:phosphopantothenoylcysteine decarboxylase/phosphopantothenate--cysteine ligase
MNSLNKQRILLGITGGIAAYKSADLVRRLREAGAEVRVVMTRAALEFMTPLTLQAISGYPVHTNLFDTNAEAAMGHIELARWADVILIAPTSTDFMAKLAYGHADDLLSTLCLATTAPIILAPAMNQQMWSNSITQENAQRLIARGMQLIGPAEGSQACGEIGLGRLVEPAEIIDYLANFLAPKLLLNKTVVITAGPTREIIDPVRFISNRSSGKMGYALAEAARNSGATVILVSGPVHLPAPHGIKIMAVQSATEMQQAVLTVIKDCDIFIAAAAVADYRCATPAQQKIKKQETALILTLERNPDILAIVAELPNRPFCVGFAAETENMIENAQIKLRDKKLDMIAANQVGLINSGFDSDQNQLTILWKNGQQVLPLASKKQLAMQLMQLVATHHQ